MELHPYLLCGGDSRRMGGDKALLEHPGGGTLLEGAACLLKNTIGPPVLLSGDGHRYSEFGYREIVDACEQAGPLGGICAAIEDAAPSASLILAVDLPMLTLDDLRALIEAHHSDVTLARAGGRRHPTLSIWEASTGPIVRAALHAGEFALMALLENLDFHEVELPVEHLANWNEPADC